MTASSLSSVLDMVAVGTALALAAAAVLRNRSSRAARWFAAGMIASALEVLLQTWAGAAASSGAAGRWQAYAMMAEPLGPLCWFIFSVLYCRGRSAKDLRGSRPLLLAMLLLPVFAWTLRDHLFQVWTTSESRSGYWIHLEMPGRLLNGILLLFPVLILMNLERTFRSAIGTLRWRVKFVLLGLAIIFGACFYTRTQTMIFSGHGVNAPELNSAALLLGSAFIVVGYLRGGFAESDVYPSRAVLQVSLTVLLAGGYLLAVGVLAPVAARLGGTGIFPLTALFVLVALVLLSILLLSDRVREVIRVLVTRHFARPQYDFREIWVRFAREVPATRNERELAAAASRLIAETFNVLSVSIWKFDLMSQRLVRLASTAEGFGKEADCDVAAPGVSVALGQFERAFELDRSDLEWVQPLQQLERARFRSGGERICVPLRSSSQCFGLIVVADRVRPASFTVEEFDLLSCVGEHVAASMANLRLAEEISAAKERQAFERMSAFFVHDLKNMASALGLMLRNVPVHFDQPEFRDDLFRGIAGAADRINQLIQSLNSFRGELQLKRTAADLNEVVRQTLGDMNGTLETRVITRLNPVPRILADSEKLGSAVANLVLNARDASGPDGQIVVETRATPGMVQVSVADNGVGMSKEFIQSSLYRPFKTTKKKGLGIGLFQTRLVVEAHGGSIEVKSEPGSGTTFQLNMPIGNE